MQEKYKLANQTAGKLFIVPTPIGNLEDITFRAIRVLKEVDFILAEDTRTSGVLLNHYNIETRMYAHHKFNEHNTIDKYIERLMSGEKAALISDAGTPAISDPGFLAVRKCIDAGIPVECLPGPTAFVPALVTAGLPNDRFCFEGFLPVKKGRKTRLESYVNETRTIVLYESPHRLIKTLGQLKEVLGQDRQAAICREISKIHEEIMRGSLKELENHFSIHPPKGEIVIVISGKNYKGNNIE
ncbi:16S rRNA (cytidine(1402)-2'-O)-methyltransferase [Thermophagus xiamenensis]|jgi:16S rRNA (cytidine1402-2'-O)-methyltransferase|uniref:Ribosomal RNA small subunit methyltransferase I n=1 Tax=Thermophagus xiamenensis TaxID=385682 RepID=A0A1I2AGT3_9BACT|nr:16S rRNA (cytidine(1402)-2'-O)-methyltransferase [Thermophagus xiamenensis]SFE43092.1 16S rRNA (cytidine1402-2'-O)-methyltransferase [Thermophagus xiamenensis]